MKPIVSRIVSGGSALDREEFAPGNILTPEERKAIQSLAEGRPNIYFIPAEGDRVPTMRKLNINNKGEQIRDAIKNGIILP